MKYVEEQHHREQYFFDPPTIDRLADFVMSFERPCCLCAPMVGRALQERGKSVAVLDVDHRFADLPGFMEWDLFRPQHLSEQFDFILVDPPFFNVSLSQLFDAIRLLAHFDWSQKLMIAYPIRRKAALLRVFAPFGLASSGWKPGYLTVQTRDRNEIEFFGNVDCQARGDMS